MRNFKKFLALLLATMMVLGGMVTVSAAEEVTTTAEETTVNYDELYMDAAVALNDLDIVKGTTDVVNGEVEYALDEPVVRYQMALLMARIMTGETDDNYWSLVSDNVTPFDDVDNYYGAISYVTENGVVNGMGWIPTVGDNCFGPDLPITYEDALTMVVRALGYKQLKYPAGFVAAAEEFGLTEGLTTIEADDQELTRGEMFQIIYNALYVSTDKQASFAELNFGLESQTYVVVATELQYLPGTDRVYRVDYLDEDAKYVALAPLNADGTYDFDAIIHLTEEELGLAYGESELKLGYSYTIRSFSKFADVQDVVANTTETFENYGDDGKAIAAGSKYNNVNDNLVKIDGKTYKLVEAYTSLNNKPTYANKQPELIVHAMLKEAVDNSNAYYIYDDMFNILDPETGDIALMYNRWTNTYYVKVNEISGGFRLATDEDFAKYAVSTGIYSTFGVTTTADDITDYSFSAITMIDDNNDGTWDRGIYVPYSVAKYETKNETNAWVVGNSKNSGTTKKTVVRLNGSAYLDAMATDTAGKWDWRSKVQQSDITFAGEGRPNNGDYVVYYYNPYSRVFTVVENLGKPVSGNIQTMNQGTYAYDSTNGTYYYKGATATIDGETYVLGYRPYETAQQYGTDLKYIDPDIANYGYKEDLYAALIWGNYKTLSYLVLADRIIQVNEENNHYGWIAFDYGSYEKTTAPYSTYTYTGDIIGVDDEGNIMVKAYTDDSGEAGIAKIGSINGYSYGLLVEDYAALQFQFSGIGILGNNALETMKKVVICDFFKTLSADLGTYTDISSGKPVQQRQYVFIVNSVSEDRIYDIYTDLNLYWGNAGLLYRQPSTIAQTDSISFMYGISTAKVKTNDGNAVLYLDNESVILVAGKDGMKVKTGVPANNATINFSNKAGDTAVAYSISNDFIFVASKDMFCDEIYTGKDWDATNTTGGYNYYMVLGRSTNTNYPSDTTATAQFDPATGKMSYTYSNLYHINTGSKVTMTVVGGLPEYTPTTIIGLNNPKPIGAIYAEKNGEWTLLTTDLVPVNLGYIEYQSANDSNLVLTALLTDGYTLGTQTYGAVYTNEVSAKLGAVSHTANMINIVKDGANSAIYDPAVTFQYDVINYASDNVGYKSVTLDDNVKSTNDDYEGEDIYYVYKKNVSFVGTVVSGDDMNSVDLIKANLTAALTEKEIAINTQLAALGIDDFDGVMAEITNIKAAIAALTNVADAADIKNDIAALDADIATLTERAGLINSFKALLVDTPQTILNSPFGNGATIETHINAWIAVAGNSAYTNAQILTALEEAQAAIATASGTLLPAATAVNANNVTTITIANLPTGLKKVSIYLKDDTGDYNTLVIEATTAGTTVTVTDGDTNIKGSGLRTNGDKNYVLTLWTTNAMGENQQPALVSGDYGITFVMEHTPVTPLYFTID